MTEPFDPVGPLSRILTAHGPLHEDAIAEYLRESGVADPARALRRLHLEIDIPAGQLPDGRWLWLPAVLAGRVFTRRVTESEVDGDVLTITPDLAPIAVLCDSAPYQRLADGSAVHYVMQDDDRGVLALTPGTFEALGVESGDLIGLRLGDAGLVLERVATATDSAAGARLAMQLGGQPERVDALVWTACLADPTLFTQPGAPLSEIVAERGLTQLGAWLAPPEFNFSRWVFEREWEKLARRHRLDEDDALTLNTLLRLYRLMVIPQLLKSGPSGDSVEPADDFGDIMDDVGAALADPKIAELLARETLRDGRFSAGGLRGLADALAPRVPPSAQVACQWLRAVACEREGDVVGFERELLAAEAMDGQWPLPLLDLAEIASDRGDAEAALALLRRARATADHPLVYLLRQHRCAPRTDLGRNALCWCGSGRKYKKCHLNGLPLHDRVGWLYHKAIRHVLFGDWTDLRYAAAWEWCRSTIVDDEDAFNAALADPLVIDAVLFEGGGFEEFLTVRGPLLPDDEWALAQQWLLAPRAVFEIEDVHGDRGVTIRNVHTSERNEAGVRMTDLQLRRGQLVCARLAPDGTGLQLYALEPISPQQRDPLASLLAAGADPVELMAQLSGDGESSVRRRGVA
ncbi:SEC-C domain-containing protein [[Mycobacterium] zoologicum]|uniref:SEC-C domain-containing protein n=1 Tax=[Mycobacterium] zoologicum TaxID=2872311 RepID=UPI001CDA973F|nr:SEC-C domain-containing protein [Mycolicibacter sp. MYC101]MEB3062612.1 SEC-C domain-containing protein [Mycolicibacter sp. MYC101]